MINIIVRFILILALASRTIIMSFIISNCYCMHYIAILNTINIAITAVGLQEDLVLVFLLSLRRRARARALKSNAQTGIIVGYVQDTFPRYAPQWPIHFHTASASGTFCFCSFKATTSCCSVHILLHFPGLHLVLPFLGLHLLPPLLQLE